MSHEHLLLDSRYSFEPPDPNDHVATAFAESSVRIELLADLRSDPHACLDNLITDDAELAEAELRDLIAAGGQTLIDPTNRGCGQQPTVVRRLSETTGVQIVLGCGYYIERSHPPPVATMSVQALADEMAVDVIDGIDGTGVRAGIIGEIGLSRQPTEVEERVLRGAARAQLTTGVPLYVHLPGWLGLGGWVLDVVAEEGVAPDAVVLCHMNWSWRDRDYQVGLADRGAWLGYDLIGNDFFYPSVGLQLPSDHDNARAVAALVRDGYAHRLLLSGDVGQKNMLGRYGGHGFHHVVKRFVPRLELEGLNEGVIASLLTDCPRQLFEMAWSGRSGSRGAR